MLINNFSNIKNNVRKIFFNVQKIEKLLNDIKNEINAINSITSNNNELKELPESHYVSLIKTYQEKIIKWIIITKMTSISGFANELQLNKKDARKIIEILAKHNILVKYHTIYKCIKMPTEINEIINNLNITK